MKRLSIYSVALLLVLPGTAAAQAPDRSPVPDHWLTSDSLATALGLNAEQVARTSDAYAAVNRVLQDATSRRGQHKNGFNGKKKVKEMGENERKDLTARLRAIRAEYDERQVDLDGKLAALRALLTAEQQARFDALAKPRLVPVGPPPAEYVPQPRGEPTRVKKPKKTP